jgi:hypothetical protein
MSSLKGIKVKEIRKFLKMEGPFYDYNRLKTIYKYGNYRKKI